MAYSLFLVSPNYLRNISVVSPYHLRSTSVFGPYYRVRRRYGAGTDQIHLVSEAEYTNFLFFSYFISINYRYLQTDKSVFWI